MKGLRVALVARAGENLGVAYLSAGLKAAGHDVRLFFDPASSLQVMGFSKLFDAGRALLGLGRSAAREEERIARALLDYQPDLVGFSIKSMDFPWASRLARRLRPHTSAFLLAGGPHATMAPERVMQVAAFDACMRGEADVALPELARRLSEREPLDGTPNLWYRDPDSDRADAQGIVTNPVGPYVRDLDALPFPDKAIFYDKVPFLARSYQIMVGRGCPWACTYCANHAYHDLYSHDRHHVRIRSVESVIDELREAVRRWGIRRVWFCDDVLANDIRWLRRFVPAYRERVGLPFVCNVLAASMTEERARLLAEGGCREVFMGVECVNPEIRRRYLGRRDSNEQLLQAAGDIKRAGLLLTVDHLINLPFVTPADEAHAVRFYAQMQPDNIFCYWLTYTPGTGIIEAGLASGKLSPDDIEGIETGRQAGKGVPRAVAAADRFFVRARNAFPLVSLLPASLGRRLGHIGVLRLIPASPERLYTLLTTVNGLWKREQVVAYYIGYILARKRVP